MDEADVINPVTREQLLELDMGKTGFLKELLDKFLKKINLEIPEAKKALKDKDAETLRRIIHSLKGASLSLGLDRVTALFREYENETKKGNLSEGDSFFIRLDSELKMIKEVRDELD